MRQINDQIVDPGDPDGVLEPDEWNEGMKNEVQNCIPASGQTFNAGDQTQMQKAIAALSSNYYDTSGGPNALVLAKVTSGSVDAKAPAVFFEGMEIAFRTNAANTGNVTIEITVISGTPVPLRLNNQELPAGFLTGGNTQVKASFLNGVFELDNTGFFTGCTAKNFKTFQETGDDFTALTYQDADGTARGILQYNHSNGNFSILRDQAGSSDSDFVLTTAKLGPSSSDGVIDLGGASTKMDTIFAAVGAINTCDLNVKQDISTVMDAFSDDLKLEISRRAPVMTKEFRYKSAVERKGDENARYHVGPIAQEVEALFNEFDVDPFRWGILCTHLKEDGELIYMMRISEWNTLINACNAHRLNVIEKQMGS